MSDLGEMLARSAATALWRIVVIVAVAAVALGLVLGWSLFH